MTRFTHALRCAMVAGLWSCGPAPIEPLCTRDPQACEPQTPAQVGAMGESCLETGLCVEGAACVNISAADARCLTLCDSPGEPCASGGTCVETRDEQPSICFPGGQLKGEPCVSVVECAQGLTCIKPSAAVGEPERGVGVCSARCDAPGGLCEDGALCLPTGGEAADAVCLPGGPLLEGERCAVSVECGRGLRCLVAGEESLCVRACERDGECREGMSCERLLGDGDGAVCRPDVGAACVSASTCPEGTTCSTMFEDPFFFANLWPQGACAQATCDASSCVAGSVCRPVGEMLTVCAPRCASDADCRVTQGWRCLDASSCEASQSGCRAYFGEERVCHRPDRIWVLQ